SLASLILSSCAAAPGTSKADDDRSRSRATRALLIGRWRPISVRRFVDGVEGKPQPIADGSFVEFRADGTWFGAGGNYRSAGTYRWTSDDEIEQTNVESTFPNLVGVSVKRHVTVDATRLELTSRLTAEDMAKYLPQPAGSKPRTYESSAIMLYERAGPP